MSKKPEGFEKTIIFLASVFKNYVYAVRGTAGLVLQGLDMNVDDIDILCDGKTALAANDLLRDYVAEEVHYSELGKFKSYFGKFGINGVKVELMGNWQIKDAKGAWSRIYDGSKRRVVILNGVEVFVTPAELELEFFAKMGRWSAFHKLKGQIKQ